MEIFLFVLRTMFLVLVYAFIFILLSYLLKDLRGTVPRAPVRQPDALRNKAGVLRVVSAPSACGLVGKEFPLAGELKLGRGPENEVVIPDRFASNRHARLYCRNGQYWLEDLGSKNGTFLNGLLLEGPAVLANGDHIKIGNVIFRFMRWDYEVESGHRVRTGAPEK